MRNYAHDSNSCAKKERLEKILRMSLKSITNPVIEEINEADYAKGDSEEVPDEEDLATIHEDSERETNFQLGEAIYSETSGNSFLRIRDVLQQNKHNPIKLPSIHKLNKRLPINIECQSFKIKTTVQHKLKKKTNSRSYIGE